MEKKDFVSLVTLGEGSSNQGDFHEGLNFAGVHKLPVITLVQNNKLAISEPFKKQVASENIAIRPKSTGRLVFKSNGNNPLKFFYVVKEPRKSATNNDCIT